MCIRDRKEGIKKFPEGTLQFEIGIQSFNPDVQTLVSRKQNNEKAAENIRWLCENSHAHLHVDLIAGLPGEDVASFARGFDPVSYTHLRAHETKANLVCRLLLEKKKDSVEDGYGEEDTKTFFFLMTRLPPRSTLDRSSAASDVYKRQC